MAESRRVLGKIADKVLFENERVRIWEMDLPPGGRSDVHRHDLDYVIVMIEGDRLGAEPEPDSAGRFRDPIEFDVEPGMTVYVERGGVETAVNVGKKRYREILIELK
jgi:predicted metal-dependent enzyme (double-stranded beta helix superfamily)